MRIDTAFSCGDCAWIVNFGEPVQLTIGKVDVRVTNSPGCVGDLVFDNYMAQASYEEWYMCIETGIGSGAAYRLGEHIFGTEKEALEKWEKMQGERKEAHFEDEDQ